MAGYSFFSSNHGKAVVVTEDRKTVIKPDPRQSKLSVALTAEQLRVGEAFEVLLEAERSGHHKGWLEIGVTTNEPSELAIPKTMTDCKEGVTYMLSASRIERNGQRIHQLGHGEGGRSFKVGDVIAVRLNALGCVQFLHNKKCVCTIPLEDNSAMYGVVDLYGKIQQVSIYTGQAVNPQVITRQLTELVTEATGTSGVEDVAESVSIMLQMMTSKTAEDTEIVQSVLHGLKVTAITCADKRPDIAAELLRQDGPRIFTDYIPFLKEVDMLPLLLGFLVFIMHTCKQSMEFNIAIGKAGLLKHCVDDVRRANNVPLEYHSIVSGSVALVHKASKAAENIEVLRQLGYVQAAKPIYTNSYMFTEEFAIAAIMTSAFVMEEHQAGEIRLEDKMCRKMLGWFQDAILDDDHIHHGWDVLEFCQCFAKLSGSFHNLKQVVSSRGHVLFARALKYGNSEEQEQAVRAIQAHTCPQSCKLLRDVQPSWTEATKVMAADTLKQLEDYVDKQGAGTRGSGGHFVGAEGDRESGQAIADITGPEKVMESVMENPKFPKGLFLKKDFSEEMAAMSIKPGSHEEQCPRMEDCRQFVESLGFQSAYFTPSHDRCFCVECHRGRGVDNYSRRGSPPQKYSLPIGWCRFGLSVPPKTRALKVHEKWHKAFHGTKKRYLAKILELGELAVPGYDVLGGEHIFERSVHLGGKMKTDGFNSKKIFVSPSIRYAGTDAYAPQELYISQHGEKYNVQVAFEIFIAPKSYQVGKETIGLTEQVDPGFSNDIIEWTTTQQGSNVLYGLLVNMEKADIAAADTESAIG